jgi:ABC-2 type transport system ATP-binding protein
MTELLELSAIGVSKLYGPMRAVDNVSVSFGPGVTALLGPNGAGKTTLIRLLTTLETPTHGAVTWRGSDVREGHDRLRGELGYLPQDFGIYPRLTAVEFLEYLAAAKGLSRRAARLRIEALLDRLNLSAVQHRALGGLSGGMRQRVGMAQALLTDPAILVVDEPTAGLDPEERVRLRRLIAELAEERIVVLSTHIVSDVEATAGRIAIMVGGTLRWIGTPDALTKLAAGKVWEWIVPPANLSLLERTHRLTGTIRRADGMHLRAVADVAPDVTAIAVTPRVEDAYLLLMDDAG